MRNKYDSLINTITLLYGLVPIVIFFVGWLRPICSIPATAVLVYAGFAYVKRIDTDSAVSGLTINYTKVLLIGLLAFAWVYCSGIGSYANQEWDHHSRNAMFYDLITFQWPVYYDFPASYHLKLVAGKHAALNYYFTFWLPAAVAGKLAGTTIANLSLLIWSYIGVLLSFYYLSRLFNFKYSLLCVIFFILWSNFDIVNYVLIRKILSSVDSLQTMPYFQFYTSFTVDLFNPFNQTIPIWVFTLYMLNTTGKLKIFPVVIVLAYSPFGFVGLVLVYGLFYLFSTYRSDKTILEYRHELIEAVWRPDALGVLLLLIIYGLFYQAHTAEVQNVSFWSLYLIHGPVSNTIVVISYLMTFFVEAGIYFLFIYSQTKQTYYIFKTRFWILFFITLILPLRVIGINNDLASRASIPSLTVLFIITLTALIEFYERQYARPKFYAVLSVLFISFSLPVKSLFNSIPFTGNHIIRDGVGSFGNPKLDENNDPDLMLSSMNNFYSYNPQRFLFYRYLAK